MTLKDWKKEYNGKLVINYKNKYGDSLQVIKEYLDIYDSDTQRVWKIFDNTKMIKHFKTKSQALKFAKAYMRKH